MSCRSRGPGRASRLRHGHLQRWGHAKCTSDVNCRSPSRCRIDRRRDSDGAWLRTTRFSSTYPGEVRCPGYASLRFPRCGALTGVYAIVQAPARSTDRGDRRCAMERPPRQRRVRLGMTTGHALSSQVRAPDDRDHAAGCRADARGAHTAGKPVSVRRADLRAAGQVSCAPPPEARAGGPLAVVESAAALPHTVGVLTVRLRSGGVLRDARWWVQRARAVGGCARRRAEIEVTISTRARIA